MEVLVTPVGNLIAALGCILGISFLALCVLRNYALTCEIFARNASGAISTFQVIGLLTRVIWYGTV